MVCRYLQKIQLKHLWNNKCTHHISPIHLHYGYSLNVPNHSIHMLKCPFRLLDNWYCLIKSFLFLDQNEQRRCKKDSWRYNEYIFAENYLTNELAGFKILYALAKHTKLTLCEILCSRKQPLLHLPQMNRHIQCPTCYCEILPVYHVKVSFHSQVWAEFGLQHISWNYVEMCQFA
jgi:hypothetical protein